jgi:hypothetical protein
MMVESPNPPPAADATKVSTFSPWSGRIAKAVLGVGALAGVITGVVAAVQAIHPPDSEDFARFSSVAVTSGVPFSEYRQRPVSPAPMPKSLRGGARAGTTILVAATAYPAQVSTEDPAGASTDDHGGQVRPS